MPPPSADTSFSDRLLSWWHIHGRHDLPWQIHRTPYRMWVVEIMLQQTRVATVTGYFERFVSRFPDLQSLAVAELDDVLALWSGLGYYARARNLHAAASICIRHHHAEVPDDPETLESLPGIGRSTANAIVAQAFDRRAPILDGNVKRVLARHAGIAGWPGRSAVSRMLWQASNARTPKSRAADYTQAIMDLGATTCTSRNPDCATCPVRDDCVARRENRIHELPGRRPPRRRPRRQLTLLIVENGRGQILLQRRPPAGIWGGLWCLPASGELNQVQSKEAGTPAGTIEHHFTHFILDLQLQRLSAMPDNPIEDNDNQMWASPEQALRLGLPRPIRTAIENLPGLMKE